MIHVPPSWYARRYRGWCRVSRCGECGLRANYWDCHPSAPCPECGGRLKEASGYWKVIVKPILFFRKEQGEWVLKGEKK